MLFNQVGLTYLALLSVPLTWWALQKTRWGLNLRTVGENPRAADTAGVQACRGAEVGQVRGGINPNCPFW